MYGGTKSEMERLLKDAGKLANTKFDISSYSDVIEAIHVIQENMGIAGTTAKEANFTIQGSISSMKAAWGNLLPALIKGGDEFDQCVDNLIESIVGVKNESGEFEGGVINNLMPAVEKGLEGIGTLIDRAAPIIEEHLPGIIDRLLPPLIRAATSLFKGLVVALPDIVKVIIQELPNIAKQLREGIVEAFGENSLVNKAFDGIDKALGWMQENIENVKNVALGAGAAIGGIVIAVKGFKAIKSISSIFSSLGNSSDGVGKGAGPLTSLANMKPTAVLKGMTNLAIIIGGLTILAAALMAVAPYMAQLTDLKSIGEVVLVVGVLGLLGTGLAKLGEIVGKIPVATVAKGLANMAIMLSGLGALAAVFMWLSPKVAAMGDLQSILKVAAVISILGVVGTAMSLLAGIVGVIPVSTVALGLANMAIVLTGLGALTAAFLWLSPKIAALGDMKSLLKVAAVMTILGAVGTALSIFAGIAGIIPIPVVLAGLANMALVLGGVTVLITAFGALSKIPGFSDFISSGGDLLATLFGQIGKIAGSVIGNFGEAVSDALPTIGENIGKFGTNIKPLFTAIKGVDMAGVGTFFTSLVGLLGIATGNEIVEGIKSFFGGDDESALSKLGTQLSDFAKNSKSFFTTVAELPENGFTNATKMFDCLAGVKSLPKEGGVVGWFKGDISYESLANGLSQLSSEKVQEFFNVVAGFKEKGFTNATTLFDCLAGIKSLPKDGGVVGWFAGEVDYSAIAKGLGQLSGEKVKNFFTMVSRLKKAAFDNTKLLFDSLANISDLPKEGGWWDKLTGEESTTLGNIADQLGSFGEKTQAFFDQVNSLDISNLNALWASLKSAGDLTSKNISKVLDDSIKNLVGKVKKLPKQMADGIKASGNSLATALADVWKKAVQATVAPVNKVISGANWILKEFGSDKTIAKWQPYARGTSGHKGGNAIVNDGRGAELVQMPNGNTFIPRGRNVLMPNAPRGMKVLDAQKTARLMGKSAPTFRYASGTGKIDIWSYIDNSKGIVDNVLSKFVDYDGMSGYALNAGKAMVSTIQSAMPKWVDKVIEETGAKGLGDYVASAGVNQWKTTVARALKMEGVYSEANVRRTLYQMQTESGGNPRAINLWDSNAKKGIPSKGLMQVIDPTFKAYARSGFNSNIYDPLSNILASVRYATSRYGSLEKAYQGHGYSGGVGTVSLPQYTPSSSVTSTSTSTTESNTYSPIFNLTISGTTDDRTMASKVKRWVAEAMEECFEGMARRS